MGASDGDPELRRAEVHTTKVMEQTSLLDRLQRFSDWGRMVKAIARLKRCVGNVKGLKERSESTTLDERKDAEQFKYAYSKKKSSVEKSRLLNKGKR